MRNNEGSLAETKSSRDRFRQPSMVVGTDYLAVDDHLDVVWLGGIDQGERVDADHLAINAGADKPLPPNPVDRLLLRSLSARTRGAKR